MKKLILGIMIIGFALLLVGCGKQSIAFDAQNETAIFLREVTKGKTLEQPADPVLEGHTFLGWFTDVEDGQRWDFSQPVGTDLNLYARWEPITLSVTFLVDPQHEVERTVDVKYGQYVEVPDLPDPRGYTFVGWYTDEDAATQWNHRERVTESMTLRARWEQETYRVVYHEQEDQVIEDLSDIMYAYGDEVIIADGIEQKGWSFIGWYCACEDADLLQPGEVFMMPAKEVSLYARWELPVHSIHAGGSHTLMVLEDGTLLAMGNNANGQLGDGTRTDRKEPVVVASSVSTASSGYGFSLYVDDEGTLWGTGANHEGQLGVRELFPPKLEPVKILDQVQSVSAGLSHTLVVRKDGTLWTMGNNEDGQLGDGTVTNRSTPVQVADSVRVAVAGSYHSLFIREDNTLWAMGWNDFGQLGDGTTQSRRRPVRIMNDVSQIAAGEYHTLVLKTDGTLHVMGRNDYAQLGLAQQTAVMSSVQVADRVSHIAAGAFHSWYIDNDTVLWGTGSNTAGELQPGGPGRLISWEPLYTGVRQVTAGSDFTLMMLDSGALVGIGMNGYGQLGPHAR